MSPHLALPTPERHGEKRLFPAASLGKVLEKQDIRGKEVTEGMTESPPSTTDSGRTKDALRV